MPYDEHGVATSPSLEALAFLVRSPNRIRLLGQLSAEEQTRQELQDRTDISQPTLGRILGDFEDRGWVRNHHNGAYSLTATGGLIAGTIDETIDVVELIQELADVQAHIPPPLLNFDPHTLATASVITPSDAEPMAHMRRFDELVSAASSVKMFTNVLSCSPTHEITEEDRAFLANIDELIVTADALGADLNYDALFDWLSGRMTAGELTVHRYERTAEFLFAICDETAAIVFIDDDGMPCALFETDVEPMLEWTRDEFAQYRRESTPVMPADPAQLDVPTE